MDNPNPSELSVSGANAGESAASLDMDSNALLILPVRETVLFPGVLFPISIGRPLSIAAVQQAMREERQIGILMQRDPETPEPSGNDMHRVGTVANIARYLTAPDGSHHVVVQGIERFRVLDFIRERAVLGRQCAAHRRAGGGGGRPGDRSAHHALASAGHRGARAVCRRCRRNWWRRSRARHVARRAGRSHRRLYGYPAGEKQEILETVDLNAAHGQGLAAPVAAHRGVAPHARRSAGRPRRCSTSASARRSCASRWPRSSASSAKATARPRRSRS